MTVLMTHLTSPVSCLNSSFSVFPHHALHGVFFLSHTLISLLPFNLVSAFFIIKRCILFKLRTRSTELLPFSYILPFHSQFVSLKVFISSNTDNVKMS